MARLWIPSLGRALVAATPDLIKLLLEMVVEQVTTKVRVVDEIRLPPEAMRFFGSAEQRFGVAPRTDSGAHEANRPTRSRGTRWARRLAEHLSRSDPCRCGCRHDW